MAECSECGKQTMSFTCHYCGKKFCSEHRLPENHDCQGLDSGKKEEYMPESSSEEVESKKKEKVEAKASSGNGKWFKDKSLKDEVRRERGVSKPSLSKDILDVFKNNITYSIIAITVVSFFLQYMIPGYFNTLVLNPQLSSILAQPWSLLTVALLHGGAFHLFANMVTFYFFGSTLEKTIGAEKLLKFYIGTALVSSLGYVTFSNILHILHGTGSLGAFTPAVGASGAVVAAVGAVAVLYPDAEVLLYFVVPMKIKTAVYAFGAIETANMIAKLGGVYLPVIGGFASSAHLAGLAVGIMAGKKYRDRVRNRRGINIFQ